MNSEKPVPLPVLVVQASHSDLPGSCGIPQTAHGERMGELMKPLLRSAHLGLFLVALGVAPAAPGQEKPPKEIPNQPEFGEVYPPTKKEKTEIVTAEIGTEYVGTLLRTDQRDSVRGTPCHIIVFKLEKDKTYLIDMKKFGGAIDPYLRLEKQHGEKQHGQNVHLDSDDDSGGQLLYGGDPKQSQADAKRVEIIAGYYGRQPEEPIPYRGSEQDARITFACKEEGNYRIIATTYAIIDHRAGHKYRLRVTEQGKEDEYNGSILEATTARAKNTDGGIIEAEHYYTKALEIHRSPNVYRERGAVHTALGKSNKALEDDKSAVELNQSDGFSWYYRGMDYRDLAKRDLKELENMAKRGENDKKYEDAIRKHGEKYDAAIEDYTEALKRDPNRLDALAGRGDAFLRKKNYDRAIDDLTKLLGLDPKSAFALRERAFAYFGRAIGDLDEAIGLEKGKSLYDPAGLGARGSTLDDYYRFRGQVYNDRGRAYYSIWQKERDGDAFKKAEGDYKHAKGDYLEAARADREDAANWNALAWLLATAPPFSGLRLPGDGKRAVEMAENALERARGKLPGPPGPDVKLAEKSLEEAMLKLQKTLLAPAPFDDLRDEEEAVKKAKKALKRARELPGLLGGDVRSAAKNLEVAILELEKTKERDDVASEELKLTKWAIVYRCDQLKKYKKYVPEYLDTLAAAYAETGDFEKASGYQEQAINSLPPDATEEEHKDFEMRLKLYRVDKKPYRENGS